MNLNTRSAKIIQLIFLIVVCISVRWRGWIVFGTPSVKDDASLYMISADQLKEHWRGAVYPQPEILSTVLMDRKPFYPLMLSLLFLIFPAGVNSVIWFQIFLDVMSTILVFSISRRIRPKTGLWSGLLYCISLPAITMVRYVMTESLGIFLLILAVYLIRERLGLIPGTVAGLMIMTRPSFVVWPAAVVAWGVLRNRNKHRIQDALLFLLGVLITWLPLKVWLSGFPKSDELWSSRSSIALVAGYDLRTDGWWVTEPVEDARPQFNEGIDKVKSTLPFHFVRLAIVKLYRMYLRPMSGHDYPWAPDDPPLWITGVSILYWLLLLLAALRVFKSFFCDREWILAVTIFAVSGLHALLYAHQRYAVVVLPAILILAVQQIADFKKIRESRYWVLGTCLFLMTAVIGYTNDHRKVEWILFETEKSISRTILVPEFEAPADGRLRIDVRLLKPGMAGFKVFVNNESMGMVEFQAFLPWDSPGWISVPWNPEPGVYTVKINLAYATAPVAYACGSLSRLPEDRKSYNRWWILGDARILSKNEQIPETGPVIAVEIPVGSGHYF